MNYPQTVHTDFILGTAIAAAGTTYAIAMKVPSDATGGGLTVTQLGVASRNAIAAGSSPDFMLVTLSTACVLDGTIGTIASGAFTAGTAKAGGVVTAFVDADKYIAWKVAGTAANADALYVGGFFNYLPGK